MIVEPSAQLGSVARSKGHLTEEVYLTSKEAQRLKSRYGSAKMVFCRHVLEHVPDPEDFVKALRTIVSDDGVLFLETPDALGVTEKLLGHELWDEHIFYFTEAQLLNILCRYDFTVESVEKKSHRGGTNILIWAKAANNPIPSPPQKLTDAVAASHCKTFKNRWQKFSRTLTEHVTMWPKPVVCMGASHPQSNFVLYTGIGPYVDFMLDDDATKSGKFVPIPNPVPVFPTDILSSQDFSGTVLLTAFGCDNWNLKVTNLLYGRKSTVVDPYAILTLCD